MRNYKDSLWWKVIRTVLEVLLIAALIYGFFSVISGISAAENVKAYILCMPGDYVNAREKPSRKSQVSGYLDPCDEIVLDGETKNGFAHIASPSFETDGWVYLGYVSLEKPVWKGGQEAIVNCNGRLAARKNMTGDVRKWLKNGTELQVLWWTDEWSVTNYGFVRTEYIELVGEAR